MAEMPFAIDGLDVNVSTQRRVIFNQRDATAKDVSHKQHLPLWWHLYFQSIEQSAMEDGGHGSFCMARWILSLLAFFALHRIQLLE
jgi:hypothetical protein